MDAHYTHLIPIARSPLCSSDLFPVKWKFCNTWHHFEKLQQAVLIQTCRNTCKDIQEAQSSWTISITWTHTGKWSDRTEWMTADSVTIISWSNDTIWCLKMMCFACFALAPQIKPTAEIFSDGFQLVVRLWELKVSCTDAENIAIEICVTAIQSTDEIIRESFAVNTSQIHVPKEKPWFQQQLKLWL